MSLHLQPFTCCRWRVLLPAALIFCFGAIACSSEADNDRFGLVDRDRHVPAFSADSAYHFIEQQVAFGPRNPGSAGHAQAMEYLAETLRKYAGNRSVFIQRFTHVGYEEDLYDMGNIIASFRPDVTDRIMLLAHWDTRPRAERDGDPRLRHEPIPGADDGGSGVGVLLELARLFRDHPPPVGVDIILFDGEDYGHEGDLDYYFLGARHWAANPPVPGYRPRFGILLDMVGGEGAVFPKEGFSMQYAPQLVREVWAQAAELGYEELFPDRRGSTIADDHWIVNRDAGIPTINIIHHKPPESGGVRFPEYWHTHDDNMEIISRETLQAVGEVMTHFIYTRIGKQQNERQ
ncbi:M28 family peptidase [Balneolales bacterium ANBcel1]|nr:M28 family peptidase [Balneolales bacterium ANBcel1]